MERPSAVKRIEQVMASGKPFTWQEIWAVSDPKGIGGTPDAVFNKWKAKGWIEEIIGDDGFIAGFQLTPAGRRAKGAE